MTVLQLGSKRASLWAAAVLAGLFFLLGAAASGSSRVILFFGDSITAGYGLDMTQAFPAVIQEKIDAKGWPVRVINAGQSGDTTSGGLSRIDWLLRSPVDILVLELGGNDALRGIPPDVTEKNLQAIIDRARAKYPQVKVVIAGMMVPPNMGRDFSRRFNGIFPELAKRNGAVLIPFVLEGVGGVRELNLPDGIHPTAKGHQIVAANVWKVLEPLLTKLIGAA